MNVWWAHTAFSRRSIALVAVKLMLFIVIDGDLTTYKDSLHVNQEIFSYQAA
jgi:hypothetical protein